MSMVDLWRRSNRPKPTGYSNRAKRRNEFFGRPPTGNKKPTWGASYRGLAPQRAAP